MRTGRENKVWEQPAHVFTSQILSAAEAVHLPAAFSLLSRVVDVCCSCCCCCGLTSARVLRSGRWSFFFFFFFPAETEFLEVTLDPLLRVKLSCSRLFFFGFQRTLQSISSVFEVYGYVCHRAAPFIYLFY